MANVLTVNEQNFDQEVINCQLPVVVDFWAPWCGPCIMMAPVVEKVAEAYAGKVKFAKLNTDENFKLAGHYQITGIPSLLLFKSGQVVDRLIGYVPEKNLTSFLNKNL